MDTKVPRDLPQRKIMFWDECEQKRVSGLDEREREVLRRRKGLRLLEPVTAKTISGGSKVSEDADEEFLLRWRLAICQLTQKKDELQEAKEAVKDFLRANPDLGGNHFEAELILYFLKNYINIDPEFAGASFRERLENAGKMSKDFILNAPPFNS